MPPINQIAFRLPRAAVSIALVLGILCPAGICSDETRLIPMRDGAKLATSVFVPPGGPHPVILVRSPYDKDMIGPVSLAANQLGYAVVVQNTRGRFGSEGDNIPFLTDAADGCDTIEWIAAQPWCNGRIGMWGLSALGITQYAAACAGSKRITCQHVTVATPDLYHYAIYPGGVFKKAMIEDWLRQNAFGPDALSLLTSHPVYDDYWRERTLTAHFDRVNWPAAHIGGWYDVFAQGTIEAFVGYQTKGGPNARGRQKLLIGPWTHNVLSDKSGELKFPNAKNPPTRYHDPFHWLNRWLKDDMNGVDSEPAVTYYVMGDTTDPKAPGNEWRTADAWPPVKTSLTRIFMDNDRSLSAVRPRKSSSIDYSYDPKDPVPTIGGCQLTIPAGPRDQRTIESRPDVLVFTSAPLDKPLEVTGRVRAELWVSSDAPDTDFVVRLCDVYPDGRSFNVCEGALRTRFRQSFEREIMMKPGDVYKLPIDLWSTSIIFNKGHRLRVHVTSSSSPGFDPNPNTGEPFRTTDATRVAGNTLHLGGNHSSCIMLPVCTFLGKI